MGQASSLPIIFSGASIQRCPRVPRTPMDKYEITINTFNKLAEQYQDKYMDFDFYVDTFETFCELVQPDAEILEVACGPGNITRYLLNRSPSFRITGIDLAPNMIKLARVNNPSAEFQVMDSRDISTIDRQYDAILSGFCCPYLSREDVAKFIADARRLLRPAGILYLSTMEDDNGKSGFQTSSAGDQVYIHYHSAEMIHRHLDLNGFEVLKTERMAFEFEGSNPATDLFVYARAHPNARTR